MVCLQEITFVNKFKWNSTRQIQRGVIVKTISYEFGLNKLVWKFKKYLFCGCPGKFLNLFV